ncbi:MAG: prephenate dehydrogenase/arogenate dehydrogenase family protein [Clostridia bacterium]|nr:prephenate dehydrogenase/arogenate dehydrogenase family protein [Clostridia bacterium]
MESDFKIAVIGMGLIGGSLTYALRGFRNAEIVGCDIDAKTREMAIKEKAVSFATGNPAEAISGADLVILCTYPTLIPKILRENRDCLKPGAVVTDVCGIKRNIAKEICQSLPDGVDYVGGHPMAGTENSGFSYATPELFWMTGFIVTPMPDAKASSIALVKEMAHYIGATRITQATFEEHDGVIAYTSDLMHIAAAGLCLDFHPNMNRAYTAGAFRDCTRIAKINPDLWTELFLDNKENVVAEIDRYLRSLNRIRNAIQEENAGELHSLLETVARNKEIMRNKEPEFLADEKKGNE